jgi:hypothetical protein
MIRKYVEDKTTCNKRARTESQPTPTTTTYRVPLVPPWAKVTQFDANVTRHIGEYLLPVSLPRRLPRDLLGDINCLRRDNDDNGDIYSYNRYYKCPPVHRRSRFCSCNPFVQSLCDNCHAICPGCCFHCWDTLCKNSECEERVFTEGILYEKGCTHCGRPESVCNGECEGPCNLWRM